MAYIHTPQTSKVLKFPALICKKEPMSIWAEGGRIHFEDPNTETTNDSSPEEALQRVATVCKTFYRDISAKPKEYHSQAHVVKEFFDNFVSIIYNEALKQEEKSNHNIILPAGFER